ncbi:hypothetical protein ACGC1H_001313 [Rhizoctonia solani]
MMYLGSLGTQLLFVDHCGRSLKFYIHESVVGDSRHQVEHFITMEGGIIVNTHWEANFTLVQPGLPGVSELHGAAELVLRFDWVYACVNSHRMLCDGDWAGFLIAHSPPGHSYTTPGHNYLQHPYTTPYQMPIHHPPAHSYVAPTPNHTHSYLAPPSYTSPNYTTPSGPSVHVPTHHALPYHPPTYSGLGLTTSTHYQPPYRTLAHTPTSSTTSARALHPNPGPALQHTLQEQLEPRLGVEPQGMYQVATQATLQSLDAPRVERLGASQVAPAVAPKLATSATSLVTAPISSRVGAPSVSQVEPSSASQVEPPISLRQVGPQIAYAPIPQAQFPAALRSVSPSMSEAGSQTTTGTNSSSRYTQIESLNTSRAPPTATLGEQHPALHFAPRSTSSTFRQGQPPIPGSSVDSNQDVWGPGSSLKRKRDTSEQQTQDLKKPSIFKFWCQGCGLSFSQGEIAIEHKSDPDSLYGCRNLDPVFGKPI